MKQAARLLPFGVALVLGLGLFAAGCSRFRHAVGPDEGRYVASRTGESYHLPGCGLARRIKRKNLLYYRTGDDAYKDGFKPCGACHPERKHGSQQQPSATSTGGGPEARARPPECRSQYLLSSRIASSTSEAWGRIASSSTGL